MSNMPFRCSVLAAAADLVAACENAVPFEQYSASEYAKVTITAPPPCVDRNPFNNGYFSDLRLHTFRSNDAFSVGTRGAPDNASRYAFGKGDMSLSGDLDNERNTRGAHINRALAFIAVTDHAECHNGLEVALGDVGELCDFEKFENLTITTVVGKRDANACYDGPFAADQNRVNQSA